MAKRRRVVSKATRAKLSKAHRGKKRTTAQRTAQSKRQTGKHHKGHKPTAAQRAKQSARTKGRKHPHRGGKRAATARRRTATTRRVAHRTVPRAIRAQRHHRGRVYPSRFVRGRHRPHGRFNPRKRRRTSGYQAGRRRLRRWK